MFIFQEKTRNHVSLATLFALRMQFVKEQFFENLCMKNQCRSTLNIENETNPQLTLISFNDLH